MDSSVGHATEMTLRVGNFVGNLGDRVGRHSGDMLLRYPWTPEVYSMVREEGGERYTVMVSGADYRLADFNVVLLVSGPRRERCEELADWLVYDLDIPTRDARGSTAYEIVELHVERLFEGWGSYID